MMLSPARDQEGRPSLRDLDGFLSGLPAAAVLDQGSAAPWRGSGLARAVVAPHSAAEVATVLGRAAGAGLTVHPAGAGSWPDAGGWSREADVALTTRRMATIHHYEPADLTLTADAGVSWAELEAATEPHGQWLPLDPPGVLDATLGGVVASGVSGSLRGHYGAVRDSVLGVRVVTGDGRELGFGGRVVKNVAGYDLVRLLTGSRGTLGVITQVSVRLFPRPAADVTDVFRARADELPVMARRAAEAPLPLSSIELVDEEGEALAVRTLGTVDDVDDTRGRLADLLAARPAATLAGAAGRDRHRAWSRWEDGAGVVLRLSALPARLPRLWALAGDLASCLSGSRTAHAASGVVRVRAPAPDDAGLDDLTRVGSDVGRGLAEVGGGVIVSTAPPAARALLGTFEGWAVGGPGPVQELSERIRALFDPSGTLAPRRP